MPNSDMPVPPLHAGLQPGIDLDNNALIAEILA